MFLNGQVRHVPQHADSIYLHPETMRCCGIAIAQAVAVRNSAEGVSDHSKLVDTLRMV